MSTHFRSKSYRYSQSFYLFCYGAGRLATATFAQGLGSSQICVKKKIEIGMMSETMGLAWTWFNATIMCSKTVKNSLEDVISVSKCLTIQKSTRNMLNPLL
jgi:hypothetical protein